MRTVLATVITIFAVPVTVAVALDYADHLRNVREIDRIQQEYQQRHYESLSGICKTYRDFQKRPEGRDTHAMDEICREVEMVVSRK